MTDKSSIFKLELGGRELSVELRNLAEQANGNVLVRYGDTMVLGTCVMSKTERPDADFFPLTVEYEERYYAAGKIRGSRFIRRESRPSDEAILTSRLIDRAIRPRFPKDFRQEIQVVVTCLSWDTQNDADILGLVAASSALSISDIPWSGPLAALRVGKIDGNYVLNPTYEEREKSEIDVVFAAGSPLYGKNSPDDILINMIEGGFQQVDEKTVLESYDFVKPFLVKLMNFQRQIAQECGKQKITPKIKTIDADFEKEIKEFLGDKLETALFQKQKEGRADAVGALKEDLIFYIVSKYPGLGKEKFIGSFFDAEIDRIVHENALKHEKRVDGRKIDELREIDCEAGVLPRSHGSGLFRRGQTRSLTILTLGAPGDVQLLEGMEIVGKKRFMHHYNFPPYCSGEVKPMRGPGRREIGHGMLAEKALMPLIPNAEEFPYTVRVVTEILSSNGSTSMASVSSSSLALMDAGVPIKAPATGIAIGLMSEPGGKNYKILTDIQGPEDHHGDMDFKVAGTKNGITALQMDVKIEGISEKIMAEALERGKKARLEILGKIEKVLDKPRPQLSPYAPRILTIQINPEKIREVVGPGGKVINEIIDKCGVGIDIQQTGLIFVTAEKEEAAQKAVAWIRNITREVQVGEIFDGTVKRIMDFGAFVEVLPGQEGLVHISQLAPYRVRAVEDILKVGDSVRVKVISIDELGRINLSMKEVKE